MFIADELSGEARTLLGGPETDSWPRFANQGDRIAFVRGGEGGFQLMAVIPDGSGVETLGEFPGDLNG